MNGKNVKKRNWAFVLYPESAPSDWIDLLRLTGLQCAISPLHDKDINPDNEPKKPHFHILLCYPGPTTFNAVNSLTSSLNQPIPQPLESVKGYYRYFTHKDNPEKFQYQDNEIKTLNGFNILDYAEFTKSELQKITSDIHDFIRKYDVLEYCDLLDLLADNGLFDCYNVATNHTILFKGYIDSRRNKIQKV